MNAALGAGAVQLALTMFFTGAISYTTAMVAQRLGGKKRWDCARVFMQAVYLSLVSVPLLYLTIPLGHVAFGMEHLPADQLQYQKTYFNILMFGGIINLVRNAAPCFFSGIADLLEHFLHGFVLLEHGVHATDFGAGTLGYASLAATVQNVGLLAFLRGHGAEHGFHINQFLFVNLVDGELVQG